MTTRRARAEASVWLARLKAETVSAQDQRTCEAWLSASEEHRRALAEVTYAWDAAGALKSIAGRKGVRSEMRSSVGRREVVLAGLAGLGGVALWSWSPPRSYATQIGEVRRLAFEDGSSATLDTNTKIHVRFTHGSRHVQLEHGRVALTVVQDPARPFTAGSPSLQILVLGRALEVADHGQGASAVAVDGPLLVRLRGGSSMRINTGERLRQGSPTHQITDRPALDRQTAWQTGRLDFVDEPLGSATDEINRYNLRTIVLDPALCNLRISGVYRAQDADAFASSVATLFNLRVVENTDHVKLETPRPQAS